MGIYKGRRGVRKVVPCRPPQKRPKKPKPEKIDGLGPDDLKRIHKAVRQVWCWSYPWRLAKKRSMHADGFPRCENPKCPYEGKPVAKVFVDHISPVGEIGGPHYIRRMFIPSEELQCLCKKCHDVKTRQEAKERAKTQLCEIHKTYSFY